MLITCNGFNVVENWGLSFNRQEALLIGVTRRKNNVFFTEYLIVIDDMRVFALLQNESIIP